MHPLVAVIWAAFILFLFYLGHANRMVRSVPAEFKDVIQKPWSDEQIDKAYRDVQTSPTNVKPYLLGVKHRRYVVVGGSGLVGGWIVQHLLMRGEDPAAIRIVDLKAPTRPEAKDSKIAFIQTDVSDIEAVKKAFELPWPKNVAKLPLTVFHTVAIITPGDRYACFLTPYQRINIDGTKNVLDTAKANGASCFVATSSGSVGIVPPSYWPWPWQQFSKGMVQMLPNADRTNMNDPLEKFGSCYAWSKAQAELYVRNADSKADDFRTGAIRPGHAIYGSGVENTSSVTWDYQQRGGTPSWLFKVVAHFVDAQNVSIGHLAFENALINKSRKEDVGGRAYCITDPNPPILYGELYKLLTRLSHPTQPVKFTSLPSAPMLLLAYVVEAWAVIRAKYLPFLPAVAGDITHLKPATFNMCTLHLVYDDSKAVKEIGYKAPITTLEGFAGSANWFNQNIEAKIRSKVQQGREDEIKVQTPAVVPKPPMVH